MYIFDLDGTLIDSNGIWADVDRAFLSRRNLEYTEEYYNGVAHTIFPLAAAFTKKYCNAPESCEEIMQEWMDLAKDAYVKVPLKPHAKEFLDHLKAKGERMVIFTNAVPEHCRTALETHGIASYFDEVLFAQELGVDKSTPFCFQKAAERFGTEPGNCILIDDSIKSCKNARDIGMYVIGIYDPFFGCNEKEMPKVCNRFIYDFSELL